MDFLFENHVLDLSRRELRRAGERVAVEPQVFDLLVYLVENRDRVVSKDDLFESVWKGRIVSESTLTTRVNAARKALGDSGEAQRLIRTVQRKGFRFVGDVQAAARPAPPVAPAPTASFDGGRASIAVLPFANMGGDPEQEYFADGITEDIITALSKWRSFLVIARNSSFTYKGRNVDVKQVGRELGVRYVLEGSVRKAGSRLRITAQLIETDKASHIWAERYDREYADVFAIQDEISHRIAAVIEPELGRHEQQHAASKPPASLEAWDCLSRGLHLLYKFTKESIAASRPFFERAIELDPGFSRGYTSLAYTHQLDVLHGYTDDREHSVREHMRLAKIGVKLDEGDSYAHIILCFAYCRVAEFDLAMAEAHKAADANPYDAWALGILGNVLDLVGRPREAMPHIERAIALTPHDPHVKFYWAVGSRALINARDYPQAEAWARTAIEADPSQARPHLLLAIALACMGRREEARTAFDACEAAVPGFAAKWFAWREYRLEADRDHMLDGLLKAGFEGH